MAQRTLITAWEVVRYSPESDHFPTAYVEPHIYPKEQTLRRTFLGKDFYDALIADQIDYGTPDEWSKSATYASGDYVNYFGATLVSLTGSNTVQPCDDPDNVYWGIPDKFETSCYQSLWELYLRQYLAYYVIAAPLEYTTYPSGGKGVTEWVDDGGGFRDGSGVKSASRQTMSKRLERLNNDANEIQQNMVEWMNDQTDDGACDFSDAMPCTGSGNPTSKRRRVGYRSGYGYY